MLSNPWLGFGAPKRLLVRLVALSSGLAAFQFSSIARAEDRPTPEAGSAVTARIAAPSPAASHLRGELGVYAERGRQERVATNIMTFAGSLALVPTGILLSRRSDHLAKTLGVTMAVGASVPLLFVFATVLPSKMERLRDDFEERRANGMPEPQLLAGLETEWEQAAQSARQRRHIIGFVDLALGTASSGAGLFFLLSKPVAGMSRNGQYTLGYALAATGVPVAAFGARSLLQESLEETSWNAHRARDAHAEAGAAPLLGVAPLPGGAVALGTFSF